MTDDGALLAAFLEGVALRDARPTDPPATMLALGKAFRAMVAGLRAVLIARAHIKDVFRIEQTMIQARGNNPLKFSAGDDDALTALLGAGRRIDMAPHEAVADALRDIRMHEFASMYAMQSAVRAVLDGLDPAKLRVQVEQAGGMALLPAQKKARAWDAYEALHTRTVQALTDDFDSVFGKAFARAYERSLHEPVVRAQPPRREPAIEDHIEDADQPRAPPPRVATARPAPPVAPVPEPEPEAVTEDGALLAAFLEGVALRDARPTDPPATMLALGKAFRVMVAGLRAVLIARAHIKDVFRIEQTIIQARGNNPLKFAAGDDDALTALLGAGRRIDMAPHEAVADALRDIRLHELASMAAMQAAVRAVLDDLHPAKLRAQVEHAGGIALLPAQKKARAWDAFEALHTRTVQALTDDFDSVFGKAFARAYERSQHEPVVRGQPTRREPAIEAPIEDADQPRAPPPRAAAARPTRPAATPKEPPRTVAGGGPKPRRRVPPQTATQTGELASASLEAYLERLLKLIPAEVVSIYPVGRPLIANDAQEGLWAVVCLVVCVIFRLKMTRGPMAIRNGRRSP